jgi:hypothetical protein
MKYLLFAYYSEGDKTEDQIHEIAQELSPIVESDEIKYVYGPSHVVFNFITEMSIGELSIYIDIVIEETGPFKYILIPTPKQIMSNMETEHLLHLMQVKGDYNEEGEISPNFIEFLKESFAGTNPNVCSLTIDEILEKIKQNGVGSLSIQEKEKLDNYSQSIQN